MKTAMQELIEHIQVNATKFSLMNTYNILKEIEPYIEKEKEQIMNAYSDGAKGGANGTKGQHENGWVSTQMKENYYNQTYNQNE